MFHRKTIFICLLALLSVSGFTQTPLPSLDEILDRIDTNMAYGSARAELDMILTLGKRTLIKRMVSTSQGSERSFIEFLSPARDKGTKILKLDEVIRIYYPSAERVMRLSGHMLRQSMMGSDFSYQDMTERGKRLREAYRGEVEGETRLNDRDCYLLTLRSKSDSETYHTRKIWVDKGLFLGLKEELYAQSGKLLKVLTVNEIKSLDGRHYPVSITMEDRLREGSKTEMRVRSIEFDIEIPADTFSERQLMRKSP